MKYSRILFAAVVSFIFSSCHRPVAYFQPMPRPVVERLPIEQPTASVKAAMPDSVSDEQILSVPVPEPSTAIVSSKRMATQSTRTDVVRHMHRIQSLLTRPAETTDKQPEPKKKLKLGNRIRQSLGMPLRKELNWWQRISWKLKASIIIILVAVLFAILHITILAIIFGVVAAFLMISGLKRSFKVRRPWF